MAEILHRIGVRADLDDVYAALSNEAGLAAWWTTDTTVSSSEPEVGANIAFRFGETGLDMRVAELKQNERVVWECVEAAPPGWTGTRLSFELSENPEENETLVYFRHTGWAEPGEFMAHCSTKWAMFLFSLKQYLETGAGRPFPYDTKITASHG